MKILVALSFVVFLAACGGGGGGGSSTAGVASSSNWSSTCTANALNSDHVMVPCSNVSFSTTENSSKGSYDASTYDTNTYGVIPSATIPTQNILYSWDNDDTSRDVLSLSVSGDSDLPFVHLTDTSAATAWANGWTGTGTTINIIDDTNTTIANSRIATYDDNIFRMRDSNGDVGTYTVSGWLELDLDHGTIVSNIAGGDKRTVSDYTSYINLDTASITACVNSSNETISTWRCPGSSFATSSSYKDPSVTIEIVQSPGVAKDATITRSNLDLSGYTDPSTTWQYLRGFFENSASYDVVNLSLGAGAASGVVWSDLVALKENFSLNASPSGTYVIAAGNSSAPCTDSNFVNCNIVSGMMVLSSYLRNQVIVAGATKDVSGTNTIATYSNQAGVMADRYLMAEGDSGFDDSTGDIEGTSFAAPRIAGAAAIVKSKFPNLSGADVASILLLTADKDINDDGTDDFTSVSLTYGRGELDLNSALSPVGNLTP